MSLEMTKIDKRRGRVAVNNNKLEPSERLLQIQRLCASGPIGTRQIIDELGICRESVRTMMSRYRRQGHIERANPGQNPALYRLPGGVTLPEPAVRVEPVSDKPFARLPVKLPKPYPLIAAWSPPRMPTNHLQGVWG